MAIKKKIRAILIILLYLTGIPYLRFLYLKNKHGLLLRVIVFHKIKSDEIRAFKKKIKFLKKKFNIISLQQFLNQKFSKKKLNILLTFDDVEKSWIENVIPHLKKEKLSAIFFLDKRGFDLKQRLSELGFEIGGHTVNHLRLPELSIEELRKELKRDEGIKFFAYPFGDKKSFNSKVKKEVKKAGYKHAFTILPGFNHKRSDNFLMHRDSLSPKMSGILFRAWLYGGYDLFKKSNQ